MLAYRGEMIDSQITLTEGQLWERYETKHTPRLVLHIFYFNDIIVAEKAFSGAFAMNAFAKVAPILVVVIRERSTYFAKLGGAFRGIQFSLLDIGIAVEHFILQAAEEGLGTCWIGWFNEKAVKKVLGIPRHKKIDAVVSLGYPQENTIPDKTRKSLSAMSEIR